MEALEQFRQETRAWLEDNCPESMRQPMTRDDEVCWGGRNCEFISEDQRLWLQRMGEKGWTVPEWPREYGGGGLSRAEAKVLKQEMASLGCRSPYELRAFFRLLRRPRRSLSRRREQRPRRLLRCGRDKRRDRRRGQLL